MSPLQEFRHRRALDLAELAIDTAKAMLAPVLPPTGGPWRRAVRSKRKRIRRKGEKMREPVWALKRALYASLASIQGVSQMISLQARMPPRGVLQSDAGPFESGVGPPPPKQEGIAFASFESRPCDPASILNAGPLPFLGDPLYLVSKAIIEPPNGGMWMPEDEGILNEPSALRPKHTRDDFDPDYIKGTLGDALRTPGGYGDVPYPWLEGKRARSRGEDIASLIDEATREPMPVVELTEVE